MFIALSSIYYIDSDSKEVIDKMNQNMSNVDSYEIIKEHTSENSREVKNTKIDNKNNKLISSNNSTEYKSYYDSNDYYYKNSSNEWKGGTLTHLGLNGYIEINRDYFVVIEQSEYYEIKFDQIERNTSITNWPELGNNRNIDNIEITIHVDKNTYKIKNIFINTESNKLEYEFKNYNEDIIINEPDNFSVNNSVTEIDGDLDYSILNDEIHINIIDYTNNVNQLEINSYQYGTTEFDIGEENIILQDGVNYDSNNDSIYINYKGDGRSVNIEHILL